VRFVASLAAVISLSLTGAFWQAPVFAADGSCPASSLATLKNTKADADKRSELGTCLIAGSLGQAEVARAVLHVIRDPHDDLFLREDLIEAFASAPIRKTIEVEGNLAPVVSNEERAALDRTVASAKGLLAVTQAVKSMKETVVTTKFEGEFFRAFSEIAQDEGSHVLLRATAVAALEKLSRRAVESDVYDEKTIRISQETLRVVANRDDNADYFTGANLAYRRMADDGLPGYVAIVRAEPVPARAIASVPEAKRK
jgi:hypothetical protein